MAILGEVLSRDSSYTLKVTCFFCAIKSLIGNSDTYKNSFNKYTIIKAIEILILSCHPPIYCFHIKNRKTGGLSILVDARRRPDLSKQSRFIKLSQPFSGHLLHCHLKSPHRKTPFQSLLPVLSLLLLLLSHMSHFSPWEGDIKEPNKEKEN